MRRILRACLLACVAACAEARRAETGDSVPQLSIAEMTPRTATPSAEPRKLEATDSVAVAVVRELMARRSSDSSRINLTISPDDQSRQDALRLKGPRVLANFCEGEGCDFGYSIIACTTLALRSADAEDAPEVGRVYPGDTVVVETGNVHIAAPGLAILRRDHADVLYTTLPDGMTSEDTVRLAAGDSVLIWEYHGEGYWAVEHEGRRMVIDEFWTGPAAKSSSRYDHLLPAVSLAKPDATLWLRLRPKSGNGGWWRRDFSAIVHIEPEWPARCAPKS